MNLIFIRGLTMGAKLVTPLATMEDEMRIEEVLSYPILLSYQISKYIKKAYSFKVECSEMGKKVERLCQIIRSVARLATSRSFFYERPLRRIVTDISQTFERSLYVIKRCRRSLFFVVRADVIRNLLFFLEFSIYDMTWIHSTFDAAAAADSAAAAGVLVPLFPPISFGEPILLDAWSSIACLHAGGLQEKIEAANKLDSLARDHGWYRQIIVKEGGIPPLLKLLKDPSSSSEAQVAAAATLFTLAEDEGTQSIIEELGGDLVVLGL